MRTTSLLKQPNNFDLLRLAFAFIVFIHHTYTLSLHPDLKVLTRFFNIDFALNSFFVISGFLVFMSYENSSSIKEYAFKRIRRIYPAYAALILLSAVMGLVLTKLPISDYLSRDIPAYLAANLFFLNFLQPELPGVFSNNPTAAVNGALWTIRTEVLCYCCVPLVCEVARKYGRLPVFSLLYVLMVAVYTITLSTATGIERPLLASLPYVPWHALFFLSGGILYFSYDQFKQKRLLMLIVAVGLYICGNLVNIPFFMPLALAVIIVYTAVFLPYAGNFSKFGDLSYGMYILHFPILQTMIAYGLFEYRPYESLPAAFALVAVGSWLSWHLIEKKFLLRNSHYLNAAGAKSATQPG